MRVSKLLVEDGSWEPAQGGAPGQRKQPQSMLQSKQVQEGQTRSAQLFSPYQNKIVQKCFMLKKDRALSQTLMEGVAAGVLVNKTILYPLREGTSQAAMVRVPGPFLCGVLCGFSCDTSFKRD